MRGKWTYGEGLCASGRVMGDSRDLREEVGRAVCLSSWKRLGN